MGLLGTNLLPYGARGLLLLARTCVPAALTRACPPDSSLTARI
jgi:hypothetical protein